MNLSPGEMLDLFARFMMLSLLAFGGAITCVPEMHRYIVGQQQWLSDTDFAASIALAQAAPGPNLLLVAVIGYNVAGLGGAAVTMLGSLLPSTALVLCVARWGRGRRETLGARVFKAGLAPVTVGLLLSTGWILAEPSHGRPGALLLILLTIAVMGFTRLSPLWLIGTGALVGGVGWV